jgi:hypothetical protein
MTEGHTRQVFKPRSTPATQQRKVRFNSGCAGRRSDSAARDKQGKAARSDIDWDDANRRFTAAIEIRHALSEPAAHDEAPAGSRGRLPDCRL